MRGSTILAYSSSRRVRLVTGARSHHAIEPRHRFGVVVQHLRLGLDHDADGLFLSLKIGDKHFHLAARRLAANLLDDHGKGAGASQNIVVAVHAGDHRMFQVENGDRFRHPAGFVEVDRVRPALGHGAETAAAGTGIAQHHEGRGALVPALADVRAVGGLAYRMQVERPRKTLQLVVILAHRRASLEPGGLGSGTAWALVDLDEVNHAGSNCIGRRLAKAPDDLGAHQVKKEDEIDHRHHHPLALVKAEEAIAPEAHGRGRPRPG